MFYIEGEEIFNIFFEDFRQKVCIITRELYDYSLVYLAHLLQDIITAALAECVNQYWILGTGNILVSQDLGRFFSPDIREATISLTTHDKLTNIYN